MRKLASAFTLALAISLFAGAFAPVDAAPKMKDKDKKAKKGAKGGKSLYDRLGGKDAIILVVSKFVAKVAANPNANRTFAKSTPESIDRLKYMLVDQICAASGGPCTYNGKNMVESHRGMNITEDEFNALVGDLVAVLNELGVPKPEQDELLSVLGPMKPDIVGK